MSGEPDICEIHEWSTEGLARRFIAALRDRNGSKPEVRACDQCLERARDEAITRIKKETDHG
jgi:uncharacterized protein YbjQ (UPF0145 family)